MATSKRCSGQTLLDRAQHPIGFASKHVVIGLVDPLDDSVPVDQKRGRDGQAAQAVGSNVEGIPKIEAIGHDELGIGEQRGVEAVRRLALANLLRGVRLLRVCRDVPSMPQR